MRYANKTTVNVDKSKAEIEKILRRYGAEQFMYGWNLDNAVIGFHLNNRMIKIMLPLPDRNKDEFKYTPSQRNERSKIEQDRLWEQSCRQCWRALLLVIKAKLEAIEMGIAAFEDEFLAYTVLPNGKTVSDFMIPQLQQVYENKQMPKMLPMLK